MLTTATAVAIGLLVLGGLLTRLLHFSAGALGIAGGIVLLIIAVSMILSPHDRDQAGASCPPRTRYSWPPSRWPSRTCSIPQESWSW